MKSDQIKLPVGGVHIPPIRDRQTTIRNSPLFLLALCLGSALFFVMLTGHSHFGHPESNNKHGHKLKLSPEEIRAAVFSAMNSDRIAQNLRTFTQEPHVAGTEANAKVAERLADIWKQNGLEDVHTIPYDVLLSYPNFSQPNHLSVLSDSGTVLFRTRGLSPELFPPDGVGDDPTPEELRASIQWLAYSAEGTVEGEPVYCHYGRAEDFARLEREFGIASLKGKIAILRYNVEFRGDKVKHAQDRGAIGAILYSDPAEVARDGTDQGHTFPHTDWMPSGGVQRGSVMEVNGDPLTPLLPSRREFHRQKTVEQAREDGSIPSIPVLPLGYGDAAQILSRMDGPEVPREWQGGLNFSYRIGPNLQKDKGQRLKLEVQSKMQIKTIQNVIGYIHGSEEPDSWVMLGNHFDAWVYGAIDPNSGSAILAEVGRAFAEAVKTKGWRPKRTLVFCAWDGEEHGLVGSTEFVQEFADILTERVIVYLNVDLISSNQTLDVRTVPSLYDAVVAAARLVPNPLDSERALGRPTMFDSWLHYFPAPDSWLPDTPAMAIPGGGSDQATFLNFLGIPVVDFTYRNASWLSYPLYHTRYELPFVNEHLFDNNNLTSPCELPQGHEPVPTFENWDAPEGSEKVHKAVGQYWAELARSFADDPLLPINATTFAQKLLADYFAEIKKSIMALHARFPNATDPAVHQLSALNDNIVTFFAMAEWFEGEMAKAGGQDNGGAKAEWANRRLRRVDQCFVNPALGLAKQEPEKRHVLFSLGADDSYQATVMAAVQQKIAQLANAETEEQRTEFGQELALELTVIQQATLCAANTLRAFV